MASLICGCQISVDVVTMYVIESDFNNRVAELLYEYIEQPLFIKVTSLDG